MLLRTYTKEEVNDLVEYQISLVKSEFIQIIKELKQQNELLSNNIVQLENNYKILFDTKITKLEEQIQTNSNDLVDIDNFLNMEIEETRRLIDTKVNLSVEKVKDELEDLIYKNSLTCEQVLIGYAGQNYITTSRCSLFVPKNLSLNKCQCVNGYYSILALIIDTSTHINFILESLEILCANGNYYFELSFINNLTIIDKKGNIIRKSNGSNIHFSSETNHDIQNNKNLKIIKNYLDKIGVKIYYNGSEIYFNTPVSTTIDKNK